MKRIAEKVVLVAQICITLVFVLTTVLYMTGTISPYENTPDNPLYKTEDGSIMMILMSVLALVYIALSAYMLYMHFSERENLKKILLFCDSDSATRTNIKVINNIVKGCSAHVDGISVTKVRVRTDEKGGLIAIFNVKVSSENMAQSVNELRCLLADSFKNTLGLTFNTINFEIDKLNGRYTPDVKRAEELADALQEKQSETAQNYCEPLSEKDEKTENTEATDATDTTEILDKETATEKDDVVSEEEHNEDYEEKSDEE